MSSPEGSQGSCSLSESTGWVSDGQGVGITGVVGKPPCSPLGAGVIGLAMGAGVGGLATGAGVVGLVIGAGVVGLATGALVVTAAGDVVGGVVGVGETGKQVVEVAEPTELVETVLSMGTAPVPSHMLPHGSS